MADVQHDIAGVVPALADSPEPQLFGEIGRGLAGERRVGGADPLPLRAMAGGAGEDSATGIAAMVKGERRNRRLACDRHRQAGVISRDRLALGRAELSGDPAHLPVVAPAVGIGFELPLQIAPLQAGKPRGAGAIAFARQAVTGDAGVAGPCTGSTERDQPATVREAVEGGGLRCRAACRKGAKRQEEKVAHGVATVGARHLFPLALLALAACKPAPEQRHFLPLADAARGKATIERVGCGSCHSIPGVGWPKGKVGPDLDGLSGQVLIAGRLPNQPEVLASYIRNAPALVPGSAMPAMPVTSGEARDIAAYLYEQGAQ